MPLGSGQHVEVWVFVCTQQTCVRGQIPALWWELCGALELQLETRSMWAQASQSSRRCASNALLSVVGGT